MTRIDALNPVIRTLNVQDALLLRRFYLSLSGESLGFLPAQNITLKGLERLCAENKRVHFGAMIHDNGAERMIGYAYYEEWEHPVPKIQFAVADAFVNMGLGAKLTEHLIGYAQKADKTALRAEFVPDNMRVHRTLQHRGFTQQGMALDGKLLFIHELNQAQYEKTELLPPVEIRCTARDGEPYVIRSMQEDDGDALYDFFNSLGSKGRAYYCPHSMERDWLRDMCSKVRTVNSADRFVAEFVRDGKPMIGGYVFLSRVNLPLMSLGIGVSEIFKGQGLGRALLEYVQKRAMEYDRRALRLITHPTNFAAQKLYKSCGFVQVGTAFNGEQLYMCDLSLLED